MQNFNLPGLGGGVGLRNEHFEDIILKRPACNWFEIIVENFIGFGGYVQESFRAIRDLYTIIPHGVCLSIGSTDPLDRVFIGRLKEFLDEINAPWMSDHLCFTMVDHINLNELIPIPFSEESLRNVTERVRIVQDLLERPMLVENVTRYLTVSDREMSEAEFISRLLHDADCGLLLDITNVQLNSKFHGSDPKAFIDELPLERVGQVHLAGWEEAEDRQILDSHDAPVPEEVWDLLRYALPRIGPTSVLVEWDNNLPSIERLLHEAEKADELIAELFPYAEKGQVNG
jgi:uncharacterized protein (UPF0276 family)